MSFGGRNFHIGPRTKMDNLVLFLDAANTKSYPGSGSIWYDLSGNNNDFTIDGSGFVWNSNGYFAMTGGGIERSTMLTRNTDCSVIYWIKTSDTMGLFLDINGLASRYIGLYDPTNKEAYGNVGSPDFKMDLVSKSNIYDYLPDNQWHMVEFRNINFSAWWDGYPVNFNKFPNPSRNFGVGSIGAIMIYDISLTDAESNKLYENFRSRYGI